MIAGISAADQLSMTPGLICDLFAYKRDYDDALHGIKREDSTLIE